MWGFASCSVFVDSGGADRGIILGMTADTFKEILNRRPFEPFRVVMSSGESYVVAHPETALPAQRCLLLALPDASTADGERYVFCSYLHIAHVEVLGSTKERLAG